MNTLLKIYPLFCTLLNMRLIEMDHRLMELVYIKSGTQARVLSPTLAHGNSKNTNIERKKLIMVRSKNTFMYIFMILKDGLEKSITGLVRKYPKISRMNNI